MKLLPRWTWVAIATSLIGNTAPSAAADKQSPVMHVYSDGSVDLNRVHFSDLSKLQATLTKLCAGNSNASFVLQKDPNIPFRKLMPVLAIAQEAGCIRVGFLTQPPPAQLSN
jgi:biopolymer transport protein ExbD